MVKKRFGLKFWTLVSGCLLCMNLLETPAAAEEKSSKGALGVTWAAYSPGGFSKPQLQIARFKKEGFRLVTLVPTFTYAGLNRVDFSKAPVWEDQEKAIEALFKEGFDIVYKAHLDPPRYQPGFRVLESDNHSWRAGCPWRGYFDVDPLSGDYQKKIVFEALRRISIVLKSLESQGVAFSPLRFDLGSELMNSVVYGADRWLKLLQAARLEIRKLGMKGKILLSHNFSHHFAIEEDFIARMSKANLKSLRSYVRGLDAVALSQYMDLTVAVPASERSKRLATPEEVATALRTHEKDLRDVILTKRLQISSKEMPVIHLGEFGIGRGGLRHPSVWDGHVTKEEAQRLRREVVIGYKGLTRYLGAKTGRKAESAVLWVLGRHYDIFGWLRESNKVAEACREVRLYLKAK